MFLDRLPTLDTAVSDAERVEQLALLEAVKAAAAGAQAKVAVAFAASQREAQAAAGVPARKRGLGVAAQVALARRESPQTGSRHLGLAAALHTELPHTRAHLAAGRVSEWAATVVARESAHLAPRRAAPWTPRSRPTCPVGARDAPSGRSGPWPSVSIRPRLSPVPARPSGTAGSRSDLPRTPWPS